MKKFITYALIIAGIAVMVLSTSFNAMQRISDVRNEHDEWWGVHFPIEGDLVGMSYLYYEKQLCKNDTFHFTRPKDSCASRLNLFVSGDSYTGFVPDSAYVCAASYKYSRRYWEQMRFHLDTAQKNILLIQIAERYIRSYFYGPEDMFNNVLDTGAANTASVLNVMPANIIHTASLPSFDIEQLFNPRINQNLEYNLFNYNFISPVREAKAWFNYHVFSRASGNVAVSDDRKYLLLKETMAPGMQESSYNPCEGEDYDRIIRCLNSINTHYKELGFDEVYLCMVPNPVTILQPHGYNQLIPRIERDTNLKMKCIDIYEEYKKAETALYWQGDTHWNNNGVHLWLQKVNEVLCKDAL